MWKTKKLNDIVNISIGKTPPRGDKRYWDKEKDTKNIWLSIADMNSAADGFVSDSKEYVSNAGAALLKPVPANTLIMSFKLSIGKLAFTACELRTNEAIAALEIKSEKQITKEYLKHFLSSRNWDKIAGDDAKVKGKTLNKAKLKELEVVVPPLAEQQRIVAKLDAAFAKIDELKHYAIAQSTQVQLLTERVLSEQTTADDELVQLSDVCGIESGLIDPKISPYKEQTHVGAGNIVSSSNELIELKTAEQEKLTSGKYPFDETTVLYSKIRPYLKKVHLPNFKGICSADMYPLKPNSEKLDREYLFYVLLSENFTNYAIAGSARAGMPKVNRNHLFAYPLRLPKLDKQKNLVKVLNTAFKSKSELEEIIQRKIAAIDSLKSAVLTQELQSEAA